MLLKLRRLSLAGVFGALLWSAFAVVGTVSASAAPASNPHPVTGNIVHSVSIPHGPCYSNTLCYYFHSDYVGADEGVSGNDPDLSNPQIYFDNCGSNCQGLYANVWNDAGSAANFYSSCKAHVFFHASYTGTDVTLSAYPNSGYANPTLGADNNNNRSQKIC